GGGQARGTRQHCGPVTKRGRPARRGISFCNSTYRKHQGKKSGAGLLGTAEADADRQQQQNEAHKVESTNAEELERAPDAPCRLRYHYVQRARLVATLDAEVNRPVKLKVCARDEPVRHPGDGLAICGYEDIAHSHTYTLHWSSRRHVGPLCGGPREYQTGIGGTPDLLARAEAEGDDEDGCYQINPPRHTPVQHGSSQFGELYRNCAPSLADLMRQKFPYPAVCA